MNIPISAHEEIWFFKKKAIPCCVCDDLGLLHDDLCVGDGETVEEVHEDHHDQEHEHQQKTERQPS